MKGKCYKTSACHQNFQYFKSHLPNENRVTGHIRSEPASKGDHPLCLRCDPRQGRLSGRTDQATILVRISLELPVI